MRHIQLILLFAFFTLQLNAQKNPMEKFNLLIGKWVGEGAVSESKSVIHSEFNYTLNNNFIEVKNHSEFEPTEKIPDGEIHDDWGIISFDNSRKKYVFRQFHVEGFVNQYILIDSLSNETTFVFDSEVIENFVPGGKARFTIRITENSTIETQFDLAMPGQEYACYGLNSLKKQ